MSQGQPAIDSRAAPDRSDGDAATADESDRRPAQPEQCSPTLNPPQGPIPSLSDPGEQLPFPTWSRYRLIAFLGAGGMGSVYKAEDPRLSRRVAIKFLRTAQPALGDSRQRRQFEREARAQAQIEHPHICKIYEVGEVQGQPYIAMQLITGATLGSLFAVMSYEQKARVVQQVAQALQAAHAQGLIHRDIKPSEISRSPAHR